MTFDRETVRERFPEVHRILDLVSAGNPLQRKRIARFHAGQGSEYWEFAEDLSLKLNESFLRDDVARAEAARAYNRMCMDILREQIRFKKTGSYLLGSANEANASVYSQPHIMRYYIVGLLLSYLFWPNHFRMFQFFRRHVATRRTGRCLEVGVGHGLFTAEVMRQNPRVEVTVVDISDTSLTLAREMLDAFDLDPADVRFVHGDYLTSDLGTDNYDLLVMGEVLEHVDDAPDFLRRAKELIHPTGRIFMSTCANCPAVDHVYHFHNVAEIRALIEEAGLSILDEEKLPAEPLPEEDWEKELLTINYAAILGHGIATG
jgi:2-polyprenyl-3-methyl-5-hydroxy-6-metoxy-1,4-benzoquinol methylase